jgi:zinc protease
MDSISKQIIEKVTPWGGRIFVAPQKSRDIVSIKGSVLGSSYMLPTTQRAVLLIPSQFLYAGTKSHSKDVLRESLATRGARIAFSSSGDRTYFSGYCLPEDTAFVLQTISECLDQALYQEKELAQAKEIMLGRLDEEKTDTRSLARAGLSNLIFDKSHVNYEQGVSIWEKSTKSVTRKEILDFTKIMGRKGLILAIVGNVDPVKIASHAEKVFSTLKDGTSEATKKSNNSAVSVAGEKLVRIPDKANIDVFMGGAISLMYEDPLFLPLNVVSDMLGGGFAAHLMQTVRERDGLTYGIYSRLSGFDVGVEGSFIVAATFSPELYEKGVTVTKKEIQKFFSEGMTEKSLASKKDEILGTYVISLATTTGLSQTIRSIAEKGHSLEYLDSYIEDMQKIKLEDIQNAAKLIPLKTFSLAAAGTFTK